MRGKKTDADKLLAALRRKAFGYSYDERTAEYDSEGNEIKNKVTTKEVPPDMSAIKLLFELRGDEEPSEEELERERERLLALLAEMQCGLRSNENQEV